MVASIQQLSMFTVAGMGSSHRLSISGMPLIVSALAVTTSVTCHVCSVSTVFPTTSSVVVDGAYTTLTLPSLTIAAMWNSIFLSPSRMSVCRYTSTFRSVILPNSPVHNHDAQTPPIMIIRGKSNQTTNTWSIPRNPKTAADEKLLRVATVLSAA